MKSESDGKMLLVLQDVQINNKKMELSITFISILTIKSVFATLKLQNLKIANNNEYAK